MRAPFFSIVIPVYNAGKYLDDCLLSIKKQSFTSWECICVDDGSIDFSYQPDFDSYFDDDITTD